MYNDIRAYLASLTGKCTYSGYPLDNECICAPFNYTHQRERQVLRHIATLIHFYLKARGIKTAVETQCMAFSHNTLFIGENKQSASQAIGELLSNKPLLQQALNTVYGRKKSIQYTVTHRFRQKQLRYISEVHSRRWVQIGHDIPEQISRLEAIAIYHKLLELEPEYLDTANIGCLLNAKSIIASASPQKKLYVVYNSNDRDGGRHIEKKFGDILRVFASQPSCIQQIISLENIPPFRATQPIYISGKMRPCISCASELELMQQSGIGLSFNPRPGSIYKAEVLRQSPEAQQFLMRRYPKSGTSYKTYCAESNNNSTTHYDDFSDSPGRDDLFN